ncbi:hypothetical protein C8F04DRAFT_1190917 [Mycena alexandri]|uniref:Uncharacterized protein n=1 Tax=Mycena alexandri TaxID=1745969 RepID=A0AAD6SFB5_9AGAR|nr:hypothetical protein C8F04DRAFT_1190917 [Mycena alexandri]
MPRASKPQNLDAALAAFLRLINAVPGQPSTLDPSLSSSQDSNALHLRFLNGELWGKALGLPLNKSGATKADDQDDPRRGRSESANRREVTTRVYGHILRTIFALDLGIDAWEISVPNIDAIVDPGEDDADCKYAVVIMNALVLAIMRAPTREDKLWRNLNKSDQEILQATVTRISIRKFPPSAAAMLPSWVDRGEYPLCQSWKRGHELHDELEKLREQAIETEKLGEEAVAERDRSLEAAQRTEARFAALQTERDRLLDIIKQQDLVILDWETKTKQLQTENTRLKEEREGSGQSQIYTYSEVSRFSLFLDAELNPALGNDRKEVAVQRQKDEADGQREKKQLLAQIQQLTDSEIACRKEQAKLNERQVNFGETLKKHQDRTKDLEQALEACQSKLELEARRSERLSDERHRSQAEALRQAQLTEDMNSRVEELQEQLAHTNSGTGGLSILGEQTSVDERERLEKEVERLEEECRNLQERFGGAGQDRDRLKKEVERLEEERRNMQNRFEAATSGAAERREGLEKEVERLEEECRSLQGRCDDGVQERDRLKKEVERLAEERRNLRPSAAERREGLEKEVKRLEEECRSLQGRCDDGVQERDRLKKEVERLAEERRNVQDRFDCVQEERDRLKREVERLEEERRNMQNQFEAATSGAAEKREELEKKVVRLTDAAAHKDLVNAATYALLQRLREHYFLFFVQKVTGSKESQHRDLEGATSTTKYGQKLYAVFEEFSSTGREDPEEQWLELEDDEALTVLRSSIWELHVALNASTSEELRLCGMIKQLEVDCEKKQQQLEDSECKWTEEKRQLGGRIAQLTIEHETTLRNASITQHWHDTQLEELQGERVLMLRELKTFQEKYTDAQNEIKTLTAAHQVAHASIQSIQSQAQKEKTDLMEAAGARSIEASHEIQHLQTRLKRISAERKALQERVEAWEENDLLALSAVHALGKREARREATQNPS